MYLAVRLKNTNDQDMVGIVILNLNKQDSILSCLRSVNKQYHKLITTVVVDNGSTDRSCELISSEFPNVYMILNGSNRGVAGGRNIGFNFLIEQKNNINYILFLDNDTLLDNYAIQEMLNSFSLKEKIGIVTPKLLRLDGTFEYAGGLDINLITGKIRNIGASERDKGQYDYCSELISSSGGIFMIRKNLLIELGGFDEYFNPYGWEDVDLSIRLRKKGFKIYYNYKAIVYHAGGRSTRGFIKEYELSKTKNYFYLIRKHSNPFNIILFYLLFPFRLLIVSCGQIRRGEAQLIFPQISGIYKKLMGKF